MISRREFLRGGAVAGIATTLPAGAVIAASQARPTVTFDAICDTRYQEGDQFLRTVSDQAYRVHGLGSDPGSVMPAINAAVAEGRAITGLTTDAALLLAEQLATAEGYALTYKGVHKHLSPDQIEHQLTLAQPWQESIKTALLDADDAWPGVIAKLMITVTPDTQGLMEQRLTAPARRHPESPGHLVSWILQPV
jgi:hypothetical protein